MVKLKPCPFCGGEASLHSLMSFREFVSGSISTAISAYCCKCSAEITVCRPDVPDITSEAVAEMWNQQVSIAELEQLRADNMRIRGALREFIGEHEECSDEDGWSASMCSLDALHNADEALDRTPDESFGEVQKLREEAASVKRERDELLAALVDARHALQFANDTPNGPICDTIWMVHGPETLFDFMDAAITRMKGGAA